MSAGSVKVPVVFRGPNGAAAGEAFSFFMMVFNTAPRPTRFLDGIDFSKSQFTLVYYIWLY